MSLDLNAIAPKLAEVVLGCRRISITRAFDGAETSKVYQASVDANTSLVRVRVREFVYFYSFDPRLVIAIPAFVPPVLRTRREPQIYPPIIDPVSVYMVNLIRRVFARDHLPDNSMSSKETAVYFDVNNVDTGGTSSTFAAPCAVPAHVFAVCGKMFARAPAPRQRAGIGIIRKALVKIFGIWQRSPSHRSLLHRDWWLEAARSTSSDRLAHSSRGVC